MMQYWNLTHERTLELYREWLTSALDLILEVERSPDEWAYLAFLAERDLERCPTPQRDAGSLAAFIGHIPDLSKVDIPGGDTSSA
jgi:hypothetical protein